MQQKYELAVIGGGVAGYAAALTAKSLNLSFVWLAAEVFGGKTRAAEYVRNYPAFTGDGAAFSAALERQRAAENVPYIHARADGIYKTGREFVISAGKESYRAEAVVLATGVELSGNVRGEREFLGRGVSYCAVCDGALYRGKIIAAVLSSPEFCGDVEYLAGFAETVHCFTGENVSFEAENIVVHRGKPEEIRGGARVEEICENGKTLSVSGVFFLKNSLPPAALCGGLQTDGAHISVGRDLSTNIAGLFAAGDITGTPYQFAKAAGEGLQAAYSARAYLKALHAAH